MMRYTTLATCITGILAALSAPTLLAQNLAATAAPSIVSYTMPEVLEGGRIVYPDGPLMANEEGLVQLNLMVDTEGRVFEPTVVSSMGSESFRRAALRSLDNMVFRPAMVDGEPTVSSYPMIVRFTIEEAGQGARPVFVRRYRQYQEVLEESGQEEAQAALAKLIEADTRNHYENAFKNLAQYLYYEKYGNDLEQMNALSAALAFADSEDDTTYLPEEMTIRSFRQLFRLQVANNRLKEAIATYDLLAAREDTDGTNALRSAYEQLLAVENDDTEYAVRASIEADSWNIALLKYHVYLERVEGKISEFKLRCSSHYIGFAVEPLVSYDVPDAWGDCSLQVIGESGTNFILVQH